MRYGGGLGGVSPRGPRPSRRSNLAGVHLGSVDAPTEGGRVTVYRGRRFGHIGGGRGGGCRLGLIEPPSLVARLGGESQQRPVSYVNSSLFTESVCNQLSATEERESAQRA